MVIVVGIKWKMCPSNDVNSPKLTYKIHLPGTSESPHRNCRRPYRTEWGTEAGSEEKSPGSVREM